jgi:hypothetical protein
MTAVSRDLAEIIDTIAIDATDRFRVAETIVDVPAEAPLASLLTDSLYRRLYCRPTPHAGRHGDTRATRTFVETLSTANCGTGTWEPGWTVRGVEPDGALVVGNNRDGLTLWAQPRQFRSANGAVEPGSIGRLQVGKELREMLPGYYAALGDADQPADEGGEPAAVTRLYWHLTAAAAPTWIEELTRRFNDAEIPFRAKVLSAPSAYYRADAGVLYLARADFDQALSLLLPVHRAVSRGLRSATPMFTKRLARGLAAAEDPGDGRSFGQQRCGLVAEGLARAFEAGATTRDGRTAAITARFAEEGLRVARPWLSPGSRQRYVWPTRSR